MKRKVEPRPIGAAREPPAVKLEPTEAGHPAAAGSAATLERVLIDLAWPAIPAVDPRLPRLPAAPWPARAGAPLRAER
jgi:hypothetical protein